MALIAIVALLIVAFLDGTHTTRYVIFFHGIFSRFFHLDTFPSFSPPPSHLSSFFNANCSHILSKKFPREFFTFFPLFGFSHFPHTLFPHFSPIFSMNFFHIFSRYFPHFPLLFFPKTFHTIFNTHFPHFSHVLLFSTLFLCYLFPHISPHYFFHSLSTLFPCYCFPHFSHTTHTHIASSTFLWNNFFFYKNKEQINFLVP